MHGYGDTSIKKENMTKLVYVEKLGGNMSFLNFWMLQFVVIKRYS